MPNNISEKEQLLQELLINDEGLRSLSRLEEKINIFDIIQNGDSEIRHSKVLSWLMDSAGNHGIGEHFVREFIKCAISNNPEKANIMDWAFLNYSCSEVKTEEKTKDGFVDITINLDDNHLVAVENKTQTSEHNSGKSGKAQTEEYREAIEEKYPEYTKLYIYLTPNSAVPNDEKHWCILSYENVLNIIENILEKEELYPEVRLILTNYCSLIKQKVICRDEEVFNICNEVYDKNRTAYDLLFECLKPNSKNDLELVQKCKQIYHLYNKELDLLSRNRKDDNSKLANMLKELIKGRSGYNNSKSGKNYVKFTSEKIDERIPKLPQANSAWNNTNSYQLWFYTGDINKKSLTVCFELGGVNLSEEIKLQHDKLIAKKKPEDKRPNYTYKRIFSENINLSDIADTTVEKAFDKGMKLVDKWVEEICVILDS